MNDNAKVAWGDESVRMLAREPMYLMAACVLEKGSSSVVNKLIKLKPSHASKIHWREMSIKAQKDSLALIADLAHSTTIVVGAPLNGKKQERARRKCLELLLSSLEAEGVATLILESRGDIADKRDIDFLLFLRRTGLITKIDLKHALGKDEDCLCIPDQILGAYGDLVASADVQPPWKDSWNAVAKCTRIIRARL